MLRSLNPDTGKPKSKEFLPTKEEAKSMSAGELDYINRAAEDNETLLVTRAVRRIEETAIREKVLGDKKKEEK